MKIFQSIYEASLYADSVVDTLFALEEKILPINKYLRYGWKHLKKNEFHVFNPKELGKTGFFCIPYTNGKQADSITTIRFMPCMIGDSQYYVKFQETITTGLPDKLPIFSDSFIEEYRNKNNMPDNLTQFEVAAKFFGESHHGLSIYAGKKKLSFSKEGVEIAEAENEGFYVTTSYDNSLKLDLDALPSGTVMPKIYEYVHNCLGESEAEE